MLFRLIIGMTFFVFTESVLAQSNVISTTFYFDKIPTSLSNHQYNQAGRLVASQYFSRTQNGSWGIHTRDYLEYDLAGRVIFQDQLTYNYSPDSLRSKTTTRTTYNDAGNVLTKIVETAYYKTSVNQYPSQNKNETIYEYNPQGCQIKTIIRYYDNGQLYNEFIEYHETDVSCRRLKTTAGNLVTLWKYNGDELVSIRKYEVESDSVLLEELVYTNKRLVLDFVRQQQKMTYAYDEQGNQIESKTYYWKETDYLLTSIITKTHDEANHVIFELTEFGLDLEDPQAPHGQEEKFYAYNEMGKVSQTESRVVFPDGLEYSGITNFTYRCDGSLAEWVISSLEDPSQEQRFVNTYSSPAPCDGPVTQTFQLYPNPIVDKLTINAHLPFEDATVKIISLSGQTLKILPDTKQFSPIQMDLSELNPGIYLVKIESGNQTYTQRIVKQ